TLEEISRALLAQGMASAGALAGGVFAIDETGANLELKGHVGYSEEHVDRYRLLPLNVSLPITDTFRRMEPMFVGTKEDFSVHYPELFETRAAEVTTHAVACFPLVAEGRPLGVLGLGFHSPWAFTDENRKAIRALALHCTEALERMGRFD